jgi:cyclophilin family peptidyl-prolyl cis-trans isomerase
MKKTLFALASSFLVISGVSLAQETEDAPKPAAAKAAGTVVVIETSMGTIEAKLHTDTAPITTKNFLKYVEKKHYDGTVFHRVMANFMIQGGGFALKDGVPMEKATEKEIKNESPKTKSNARGTLAMARRPDPDSASSQFFINVVDNKSLDYPNSGGHGYAVFGEVIKGMDVVDKIKAVPTDSSYLVSLGPNGRYKAGPAQNVPKEPVVIKSIRLAEKK